MNRDTPQITEELRWFARHRAFIVALAPAAILLQIAIGVAEGIGNGCREVRDAWRYAALLAELRRHAAPNKEATVEVARAAERRVWWAAAAVEALLCLALLAIVAAAP
jgi:hypothetical protein